jgi:hypothetical protein
VRNPALDVRGPRDQRVTVEEADGFAVPARHLFAKPRHAPFFLDELTIELDVRHHVAAAVAHVLDQLRRHHDVRGDAAVVREAAQETFGPAVGARPVRGVAVTGVIHLLHEVLLIERSQQRQVSWNLQHRAVKP